MSASRGLAGAFAIWMLALTAIGCGGGGVAVQSPHTLPVSRPAPQIEQVVLDALPRRGWTAESVQPGRIVAFLAVRKHLLRVEIRYDAQQVAVYYVDSDNLKAHIEANGQIYAHPSVNKWTEILVRDIAAAMAAAPQTAGAALPPPPPPLPAPLQ